MQEIKCMQYRIMAQRLSEMAVSDKQVIDTLNAYSYVVAESNSEFKHALQQSDILVADGFPIVLAARLLKKKRIQKIAGADLFAHFMSNMDQISGKVFFLGSSDETLDKIRNKIAVDYPNVKVGVYSPPFEPEFNEQDSATMIEKVNLEQPDVLFVGMTAPKQECWVEQYKQQLDAKVLCQIGAVFDFYAGNVRRAPAWMIQMKLEWFYRLIKEPRRMWKRYLVYSPLFFWYLLLFFVGIKK